MTSILSLGPDAQRQVAEKLAQQHAQQREPEKRAKFGNKSVVVDGYRFDSQREATYYLSLRAAEKLGTITELRIQPAWRIEVNGEHVCDYIADMSYRAPDGSLKVVDVKSKITKTREYRLKKKLMLAVHRIAVVEAE